MKCWIVPSSLFVPGRIMAPVRLTHERETLLERKSKLEAELRALPAKLAENERMLAELGAEYVPFEKMEVKL